MKLDTDHIVVIGFPHNQKSGGLGPETKRSMDGLIELYPDRAESKKLSLLYISGTSRSTMARKKYNTDLFMNNELSLDKIVHSYSGYTLPSDISIKNVGVIFLIHGTSGFPKLFAAQNSTNYIERDNVSNGKVIAKLLKLLGLSACIEKLQLVMCGGAKFDVDSGSLLDGVCSGIEGENFKNPPMVISWDCEVTHNYKGDLVVGGKTGIEIEEEHCHVREMSALGKMIVPDLDAPYNPTLVDTYSTVRMSYGPGYIPVRVRDWHSRRPIRTKKGCTLL